MASGSQKVTTYSSNTLIPKRDNASLSNFKDDQNLIYTYYGGGNGISDKPTSVDAFGVMSLKTASEWYGQLLMSSNTATGLYWRTATSLNGNWRKILDSSNYTDYTVTKTGSGASGTWDISINGNATTATKATQDGSGNTITSTYLKLTGGTLTGSLTVSNTGEAYCRAYNSNTGVYVYLYSDSDGTHGIWSNGYLNDSALVSEGKWLIYRNTAGNVILNGNIAWNNVTDKPSTFTPAAHNHSSADLTNIALTWSSSYTTGTWMLIYNGETGTNGGALFRAINQANTAAWVDVPHKWARIGGDTFTGPVRINGTDNASQGARLLIDHQSNNDWGITIEKKAKYDWGIRINCISTGSNALSVTGRISGTKVYGAVWNDYAECRNVEDTIEPGRVVYETDIKIMKKSQTRMQPGCHIVSDTYGMCIGETKDAKVPIAVCGRVLAYPYRDRNKYKLGMAVCSAPNGTIDIMTREEIRNYPERIIGVVSEIPDYDIWHAGEQDGNHDIKVNNRIWIYVR